MVNIHTEQVGNMNLVDYRMLTTSALWLTFNLFQLKDLAKSKELRYLGAKVVFGWVFAIPLILVLLVAYRAGV